MSLIECIRNIFKSQDKEQNGILYLFDDNAKKPMPESQVVSDAPKNTSEVISPCMPVETSNEITSKSATGFDIPDFLSHRYITKYDAKELQELFAQNKIECFGELTVEMLRSFLKYSYADAIYVIELLGLYGIKFNTAKLKQFSNPPTSDYRILKFDRNSSDISINESSLYKIEKIKLKRYLFDMKLSTTFLLDGIKLDVLLFNLGFTEEILHDLLDLKFYSQDELQNIYFREVNDENQNAASNNEVHSDDNSQLLIDFPENNNSTLTIEVEQEVIPEIEIDDLELSVRSYNALKNAGINKLDELISLSREDLYRIPNLGKKTVLELLEIQNKYPKFIKTKEIEEDSIQEVPSYIADLSISQLEFSTRLSNVLRSNDITSIRQLLDIPKENLIHFPNFGRKCFDELIEYLEERNIRLGMPYKVVDVEQPQMDITQKFEDLFNQIHAFEDKFYICGKKKSVYTGRINTFKQTTLQALADRFSLTRERIRQIEFSLLRKLSKIVSQHIHSFNTVFEKYGDIIDYEHTEELLPLQNHIFALNNIFNFMNDCPFVIDTNLKLLMQKNVELVELSIENNDTIYFSAEDITNEIKEKLQPYMKFDEYIDSHFYSVLRKIVEYNIENNFVFNYEKKQYVLKDFSKEREKLDLLFKEFFPEGIHIRQKKDDIYKKILAHWPTLNCSTPRALEARLTEHSKNIILTGSGYYQHIDTINVTRETLLFAAEECKKKLLKEGHPFLISVIYDKHKEYFEENGVFSHYLLFSLLKRLNDSGLKLRRLTVYNDQKENYSQMNFFEEYFKSQKGIISIKAVEDHFTSLGWNEQRLANYLGISTNVFKLTNGYFHKDNITCNMEKLNHIMEKVRIKIEECGYVSLEAIKNKNFVEWLGVFENEDLDAKSMVSIIRAFYPNCPYEVSSNGLISYGSKLKPYEILYKWMTQKCKENQYVVTAQITSFCEDNKFPRYNTKNQIKNKIVEIDDNCWVTYDYLGINKEIEDTLICKIDEVFLKTMKPYISIKDILDFDSIELPKLNNETWNEYIVRSIIENRDTLVLYNLVIVNPHQTDFITLDRIVANEIFNFTKTWYIDAEKLERLLRSKKILGKNETFSHKTIQNLLFHASSCIELRDKNKNVCIKADFRKVFNLNDGI